MINMKTIEVGARAIDLGYYNVKLTLGRGRDKTIGTMMFPALAPFYSKPPSASRMPDDSEVGRVYGKPPAQYFIGPESPKHLGGSEPRHVNDDYCLSAAYRALSEAALAEMAIHAGAEYRLVIQHLVLGLPVHNIGSQRRALEKWMRASHEIHVSGRTLYVEPKEVHVITQPIGAFYNWLNQGSNAGTLEADDKVLIVDVGGGTLDWVVANSEDTFWERCGSVKQSMLHCSYAVCDAVDPKQKANAEVIARIDRALRGKAESFKLNGETHLIRDYRHAARDVVDKGLDAVRASLGEAGDIEKILVVGGGGAMYGEVMQEKFPDLAKRIVAVAGEEGIYANVRGFHYFGEDALEDQKGGVHA